MPPLAAGAALTAALVRERVFGPLPAVWLLFYGVAVLGAGMHSVPVVPVYGATLLVLGLASLVLPAGGRDLLLGLGFGAGHVASGLVVWKRYGG